MNWSALSALVLGLLITWIGWRHWRLSAIERETQEEATFYGNEEPLPKSILVRIYYFVVWNIGLVIGPILVLLGVFGLTA